MSTPGVSLRPAWLLIDLGGARADMAGPRAHRADGSGALHARRAARGWLDD